MTLGIKGFTLEPGDRVRLIYDAPGVISAGTIATVKSFEKSQGCLLIGYEEVSFPAEDLAIVSYVRNGKKH